MTTIACDPASNRLAVATRGSTLFMFSVNGDGDAQAQYSIVLDGFLPKGVAFGQYNEEANAKSLVVFGMYCGRMWVQQSAVYLMNAAYLVA